MEHEEDFDIDRPDFPAIWNTDEMDELTFPPQAIRLRELLETESEITDSRIYGQFRDDGLPCYNLSVTVNGEEIKFSLWCMTDASLLFALARAPFLPKDHKRVVQFFLEETDPKREY